ncbi:MAG: hypothetical protein IKK75_05720 [Clostridia bacterium]|nr:hypothetical protein [Clostridia bacterium]
MQTTANQVRWVPVDEIIVPEEYCDDAPEGAVHVTPVPGGGYRLLSGADALACAREAGQACVDVVLNPTEKMESRISALMDALVRGDIHYLDEAERYRELLSSGEWTTQTLAERIGRTPATLRRKLRLNNLGQEVAQGLRENGLCERYAQALLRVPGLDGRMKILRHITDGGLSVRDTDRLIDDLLSRMPVPMTGGRRMKPVMRDYRLYVNAIRGIVEQMCDAGLDAAMQVSAGRNVAEVRVVIPIAIGGRR